MPINITVDQTSIPSSSPSLSSENSVNYGYADLDERDLEEWEQVGEDDIGPNPKRKARAPYEGAPSASNNPRRRVHFGPDADPLIHPAVGGYTRSEPDQLPSIRTYMPNVGYSYRPPFKQVNIPQSLGNSTSTYSYREPELTRPSSTPSVGSSHYRHNDISEGFPTSTSYGPIPPQSLQEQYHLYPSAPPPLSSYRHYAHAPFPPPPSQFPYGLRPGGPASSPFPHGPPPGKPLFPYASAPPGANHGSNKLCDTHEQELSERLHRHREPDRAEKRQREEEERKWRQRKLDRERQKEQIEAEIARLEVAVRTVEHERARAEATTRAAATKAAAETEAKAKAKSKHIKFQDAVGRKFMFPFELCRKWVDMEEIIKQAFHHVDAVGPHVNDGHYDLQGPDGEIILPQVWESVIEPGWSITMHIWPVPEPEPEPEVAKDDEEQNEPELKERVETIVRDEIAEITGIYPMKKFKPPECDTEPLPPAEIIYAVPEKEKPVRLRNFDGRTFVFPFEKCKRWKDMKKLIKRILTDTVFPSPQFQLLNAEGDVILGDALVWEAMVEPGWEVTMHVWPQPHIPEDSSSYTSSSSLSSTGTSSSGKSSSSEESASEDDSWFQPSSSSDRATNTEYLHPGGPRKNKGKEPVRPSAKAPPVAPEPGGVSESEEEEEEEHEYEIYTDENQITDVGHDSRTITKRSSDSDMVPVRVHSPARSVLADALAVVLYCPKEDGEERNSTFDYVQDREEIEATASIAYNEFHSGTESVSISEVYDESEDSLRLQL